MAKKTVAEKIKRVRVRRKITITRLSEMTSISIGHLSDIENGRAKITAKTAIKLAPILRCRPESLIDWSVK